MTKIEKLKELMESAEKYMDDNDLTYLSLIEADNAVLFNITGNPITMTEMLLAAAHRHTELAAIIKAVAEFLNKKANED